MRAVILANPCAGGGQAGRIAMKVRAACEEAGLDALLVETRHRDDFRSRVRELAGAGCLTLVALGGDGTLQLLVRETLGRSVKIGIIPAGGGNDFAAALGIRTWRQGVQAVLKGKSRDVDVVQARFADGQTAHYLGGGGIGLDAEAAQSAAKLSRWPGRLRYLAAAIAALRGFAGVEVELTFPDGSAETLQKRALLAAALNTPSYGGGLRLAPEASVDDGLLDVVVIEMLSGGQVLGLIPRLLVSGELKSDKKVQIRVPCVQFTAREACWFHGDGELLGKTPVQIQVLRRAVKILVP